MLIDVLILLFGKPPEVENVTTEELSGSLNRALNAIPFIGE